jgi:molybdate transport system ATP-binding protein
MKPADDVIIQATKIAVTRAGQKVLDDISFSIGEGDHLAILGPSGSGKTTLGLVLAGKTFFTGDLEIDVGPEEKICFVEQQHHFRNLSNTSDFYYQQRFNSYDAEDAQTVMHALQDYPDAPAVLERMKISYLANKPLIQLSNGENKRLQVAKLLLASPSVVIMDQPFVGLDHETRISLHLLFNELAKQGITVILISTASELPDCITHVLELDRGRIKTFGKRQELIKTPDMIPEGAHSAVVDRIKALDAFPSEAAASRFETVIKMENVSIQYGEKTILDRVSWEVKRGDRWLLSGPNGAGKSTLLSLVTGDNPQAYANNIWLFDRKRGSGESIWDIKKNIGYLSPELHLFFDQGFTAFETVASGWFDTIGLFRRLSPVQEQKVDEWMEIVGIADLKDKRLYQMSIGEQRTVLLARAFVKNPPLLILDEPCQGLDAERQSLIHQLIDSICEQTDKTLIYVTHYANERPRCISKFIQLADGKVV